LGTFKAKEKKNTLSAERGLSFGSDSWCEVLTLAPEKKTKKTLGPFFSLFFGREEISLFSFAVG